MVKKPGFSRDGTASGCLLDVVIGAGWLANCSADDRVNAGNWQACSSAILPQYPAG